MLNLATASGSSAIRFRCFVGFCLLKVAIVGGKSGSPAMKEYIPSI
jgi:hypothetical protein